MINCKKKKKKRYIYVALAALLEFAVDPQDEADRKEGRLAVIADHLGFSWSGKRLF